MTSLKLGKPVSFIYGEQGKYSLAEIMQPAPEPVPPAGARAFRQRDAGRGFAGVRARGIAADRRWPAKLDAAPARNAALHTERYSATKVTGDEIPPTRSSDSLAAAHACLITMATAARIFFWSTPMARAIQRCITMPVKENSRMSRKRPASFFKVMEWAAPWATMTMTAIPISPSPPATESRFFTTKETARSRMSPKRRASAKRTAGAIALGAKFVDYNGDGNLDLYVTRFNDFPLPHPAQPFSFAEDATPPGNILWRNNGDGTFTECTNQPGLGGSAASVGALGIEMNNDGTIDFVLTGWQKSPIVF